MRGVLNSVIQPVKVKRSTKNAGTRKCNSLADANQSLLRSHSPHMMHSLIRPFCINGLERTAVRTFCHVDRFNRFSTVYLIESVK